MYPPGAIDPKVCEAAERRLLDMPLVGRNKMSAPKWEPLPPPEPTPEQRAATALVAYEMHWREKGWKKDLDGKWIRDESVEFESDDEAPPPPPPPPSVLPKRT